MGEGLKGPSWVTSYQPDVICDEVTVSFTESSKVLTEGPGNLHRQSHADHCFAGGLKRDVHVVDLLA